jgi:hypothetical protein
MSAYIVNSRDKEMVPFGDDNEGGHSGQGKAGQGEERHDRIRMGG